MTVESVDRAVAAAQAWLSTRDAPEPVILSHEMGLTDGPDEAARWVRWILHDQAPDGSWAAELLATASALLTVQELREAAGLVERDPAINRGLDWLRSRRGAPGAWTEGCDPERHDRGLCHHFMTGFFSPGPADEPCEEAWLRGGLRLSGDREIRFATSAVALRCVLAWDAGGADARLHLAGLRRIVGEWDEYVPAGLSTASLLTAVHALLRSPEPEDRAAAERGLRVVSGRQRGDGSWVDADAFQALEVFGAAIDAGVAVEQCRRSLWHGARLLIASQQADGSWGRAHGARRALIAWRTFRRIEPAAD